MNHPQLDLDAEAILFDGHWMTRDDLARRIKAMLDSGDFSVGRQSQALEALNVTLGSVRTLSFRVLPELSEALNLAAARSGKSVGAYIRDRLLSDLQGSPPVVKEHREEVAASLAVPAPIQLNAPVEMDIAIPPPAPSVPPVLKAGPGALRAAGIKEPSVVVEASLGAEGPVDASGPKKKDDDVRRW